MTPSQPRLLPDNRTWALDVEPEQIPNLAIPGLKAATRDGQAYVYGYIDAVGAACKVVGVEAPEGPSVQVPELGDLGRGARDYQRVGVAGLYAIQAAAGGALLGDMMGIGKTYESILLARLRGSKRVVIVTPGRARYTWLEELLKWGEPPDSVALMLPKGAKGWKAQRERAAQARWIITSYNLLGEIPPSPTSMLMVDECHEVKSVGAQRAQATLSIARMVPYRLLISATPAWNVPKDWWFLLELAFPGRFGRKHDFEARYADGHQGTYGWVAKGVSHADELRDRLSCYLVRREKRDVAQELPPMTDVPVWLEPDAHATQAMRASALKVPGCSFYDALLATLEAKMQPCIELAHAAKRFLLFTWQRKHAEEMSRTLYEQGTPNVLIHGEMSDLARANAIALARSKAIGIVATIDSAGQSLNLQGIASQGIMHYQDPVPFKMMQARSRLHRLGITEPITWQHVLLKDSADEVVWRRSTSKLMAQEASMPAMQDAGAYREAMNANAMTDQEALAGYYAEMEAMVS